MRSIIIINTLTLPHLCTCSKPGPGLQTYYVVVFLCSVSEGEWRYILVLLIFVELLPITVKHSFGTVRLVWMFYLIIIYIFFNLLLLSYRFWQGRQENFWAPGQKETWPPSSNSPNNDTQTKSTTVCHKQGIYTTKMNWWIVI